MMSKTSKNILGDQRGRIGKVVGKVVDGVQMYSAYSNAVSNPRTERQIAHRARFAATIALGKAIKGAVNVGLREVASTRKLNSAFNVFVHLNMPKASCDAATGAVTVDYAHVAVASGDVPSVAFTGVTLSEPMKATVGYNANGDIPGARDDDSVYVVVYSPSLGLGMTAIGTRSAGTVTVTLPTGWGGETVHVWGFVRSSVEIVTTVEAYGLVLKPGACSMSSYIGTGTVLAE